MCFWSKLALRLLLPIPRIGNKYKNKLIQQQYNIIYNKLSLETLTSARKPARTESFFVYNNLFVIEFKCMTQYIHYSYIINYYKTHETFYIISIFQLFFIIIFYIYIFLLRIQTSSPFSISMSRSNTRSTA